MGVSHVTLIACFHTGPLFGSKWNLDTLVFTEGRKPDNLEKNPQNMARINKQTQQLSIHIIFKSTKLQDCDNQALFETNIKLHSL